MLDIFNSDAFAVRPLTDTINKIKHKPSRLSELGIFLGSGVATTSIAIEEKAGILKLVSPSPRGGPGTTIGKERRTLRSLAIPHFELNDAVMAEEVQGVRAWASETDVETVQGKVAEKMAVHVASHEVTSEYSKLGAVKGIVTYADGTTLDLFSTFGVSAPTAVSLELDAATPVGGVLRKTIAGVIRGMQDALGGIPLGAVHALVGADFFDALIQHAEVRDTYLGWVQAEELRKGYAYGGFPFGGVMWEEYRGSVDGTAFVAANEAHVFPVGIPGLFRTVWAPADYKETVNTIGQRFYAKQYDMPNGKGVHFDTQTNELNFCTRPNALRKCTLT